MAWDPKQPGLLIRSSQGGASACMARATVQRPAIDPMEPGDAETLASHGPPSQMR